MSKVSNIADGFLHLIFKNEKVEEKAKERALICSDCDYLEPDYVPTCGVCGCVIAAKTRAKNDKCPKNYW